MSHWRGQGRWADDAAWRSIGQAHLATVRTMMRAAQCTTPIDRMLEWGPGGGANAVAFAELAGQMIGVDISGPNLDECARQLIASGYGYFQPVHIPADQPENVLNEVTEPIDLFLCTAVFQHMPSQAYGCRVLELAHQLLRPGGLALVQIRYDDGSDHVRCKTGPYDDRSAVTFTSWRIDEFWTLTKEIGFSPIHLSLQPQSLYAYYALKRD
jgi:SAM-dependent methyltransferase